MLRSKYFWLVVVLLVFFIIVWVNAGFGWAIITLIITGLISVFVISAGGSRRRRRYYYDDEEEEDVYITGRRDDEDDDGVYVTRRRTPPRSDIQRGLDWHVPKVNKRGAEFISGSGNLRRLQEKDLKRIRKNLRGR